MKNLFSIIVQFVLMLAFAVAAMAQQATPTPTPTSSGDETLKVFEVRLPVTVEDRKDKNKKLVSGMTRDRFIVLEDGVEQEVTFFTDEKNNPPVYVGVLMDTSASTKGKLAFSKRAAKDFLYTVLQIRKDKAAFMTFDNEVNLIQDFTDKTDLLDKAVDKVSKTGSQTALYDAVYQFIDEKLRSAPGRRVVVVITDGDDTFSRAELIDVVDIAQRTETTIFGISTKEGFLGVVPGVDAGMIKDKGDKFLTQMAEDTGGKSFFLGDMYALEKAFKKISEELKSQYILTYRPANQSYDGRERKIEVRFRNKEDEDRYRVRTKAKYRAIKDTLK